MKDVETLNSLKDATEWFKNWMNKLWTQYATSGELCQVITYIYFFFLYFLMDITLMYLSRQRILFCYKTKFLIMQIKFINVCLVTQQPFFFFLSAKKKSK